MVRRDMIMITDLMGYFLRLPFVVSTYFDLESNFFSKQWPPYGAHILQGLALHCVVYVHILSQYCPLPHVLHPDLNILQEGGPIEVYKTIKAVANPSWWSAVLREWGSPLSPQDLRISRIVSHMHTVSSRLILQTSRTLIFLSLAQFFIGQPTLDKV